MVANSMNRYTIGSADNLQADAEGSITIHLQGQYRLLGVVAADSAN